jgi:hypothetical protein
LGDRLIGPFFIHGILNQEKYHQLLVEYIDDFLDELPLAEQDRATLHNARINVNWLVEKIGSFRRKLQLWTRKINEDGLSNELVVS